MRPATAKSIKSSPSAKVCVEVHAAEMKKRRGASLAFLLEKATSAGLTADAVDVAGGTHWIPLRDLDGHCVARMPITAAEAKLFRTLASVHSVAAKPRRQ